MSLHNGHARPAPIRVAGRADYRDTLHERRPIVTIMEDHSPGQHDMLFAACDPSRFEQLGHQGPHANCQDNLHTALRGLGVDLGFTPQPWNLFTNNLVMPDGTFVQTSPGTRAGDHIVLKAEIDAFIVVSACPQDMTGSCGEGASDIRVEIGR